MGMGMGGLHGLLGLGFGPMVEDQHLSQAGIVEGLQLCPRGRL